MWCLCCAGACISHPIGCLQFSSGTAANAGFFKPEAKGSEKYSFTDKSAGGSALRAAKQASDPEKPPRKRIIIAWFDHDLEDLVFSLGRFAPDGSEIFVICPNDLKVGLEPAQPTYFTFLTLTR